MFYNAFNKKMMQITNTLLMIRPVNFTFNEETAQNNFYQKRPIDNNYSSLMAIKEFDNFVNILRNHGVNVEVFEDIIENKTPDSIFPNNWISTHLEGSVILYPMFAENRRRERREDIIDYLNKNFLVNKLYKEYLSYEKEGFYLEGTGSMVLDRVNKIAYASISRRTDFVLFHEWCQLMNYKPVSFISYQNISGSKEVIYHTNVMMCIASKFAIICLESINNNDDKKKVEQTLKLPPALLYLLPWALAHSEEIIDLVRACEIIDMAIGAYPDFSLFEGRNKKAVDQHRQVLEKFGRYPQRNSEFGRANTPEEEKWLNDKENLPIWAGGNLSFDQKIK